MNTNESVFKRTYRDYLTQFGGKYLAGLAHLLGVRVQGKPRIPVILLFNDIDKDQDIIWPATCSLLFERRAESYLDPECLAMTGRLLCPWLKKAATSG